MANGRRDRHGRGLRGSLAPPGVPLARSRRESFEDLVFDAAERLADRWESQLADVDFRVEQVPPAAAPVPGDPVPLGRSEPASGTRRAQVVVYRRPVQARASGMREQAELVHDVVVEQVADLLGVEPQTIDPGYDGRDDD